MFPYLNMILNKHEPQTEPFLSYDNILLEDAQRYLRPKTNRSKFPSNILIVIITSAFWLAMYFLKNSYSPRTHQYTTPSEIKNRHNITSNAQLLECGNTTLEAKSRGCEYDILLNHWVPAPCVDHEILEEYMDDNSWNAFADEALTQRLSTVEEMSNSEVYFTSLRDHVNHCTMLWKKQFWALYKEYSAFDTIISNPSHTDHCAYFLSEAQDIDLNQATRVEKGYAGCWVRK